MVAAIKSIDESNKCPLELFLIRLNVLLVAQGTNIEKKYSDDVTRIDVDAVECDLSCGNSTSHTPLDIAEEKRANLEELNDATLLAEHSSHKEVSELKSDNQEFQRSLAEKDEKCSSPRAPSCENSHVNHAVLESPSSVSLLSDVAT